VAFPLQCRTGRKHAQVLADPGPGLRKPFTIVTLENNPTSPVLHVLILLKESAGRPGKRGQVQATCLTCRANKWMKPAPVSWGGH
jgi:hypothetical protein